eukprot:gene3802-4151_t
MLMSTLTSSIREKSLVNHPAFSKIDEFYIHEYGLKGALYEHDKSGAQVMSVIAPDDNKVFGISFRTPPQDSTGVPHILEHSVLCGSRKFPVKEPFVDLLKGSLQNFLNAFTYPDRTCYPVASTNTKDFYNLIHVYLDAVLHPRAISDPQVLQQEGWHYELDDVKDPLKIKGVVFNEMKGVYSSPDSLMGRAAQQALFPNNTYGVDSGGDPADIPKLTFDQFRAFHRAYYHPANSKIFFYGDDDQSKRLELLDEYLRDFDRIQVDSAVRYQPKFNEPMDKVTVPYPISPGTTPKHMLTVNWLLNEHQLPPEETLALGVLDYLLLGTSTSSLRKVLVESNLGESVTGGGLSDELIQTTFSVGLKGVKKENTEAVHALVLKTLEKLSEEGFSSDAIEAAVNSLEFRLREFNTGSFPKGLSVMLGMLQHWIYDRNPLDGVSFEQPLQALKNDIKAGKPIFQELLKKYLVQNNHRVVVEMIPDAELENRVTAEEEAHLATIKDSFTAQELEKIVENTKLLREAQERADSAEAKATVPKLTLEDIEPKVRTHPITVLRDGLKGDSSTILTHDLQTNGILYTDVLLDYSAVDIDDLPLLPLFTRMLMEAGTAQFNETALSNTIDANTGGISVSIFDELKRVDGKVADPDDAVLYLKLRGKAVQDKVPVLFDLFREILFTARLDNKKRAVEMLRESKARKEASVVTSGHSYAASRLAARGSFLGYFGEVTGGLTSVRNAGKLLEEAENDWPSLQKRLERIRTAIVRSQQGQQRSVIINLTGDDQLISSAIPSVDAFLDKLPKVDNNAAAVNVLDAWKQQKAQRLLPSLNEGFVIPSLVNYVAKGGSIYSPHEEVPGATSVVARYLSTGYMWDKVRVVGGAYGGFARFNEGSGRFLYLSYRDPNLLNTLNAYDGAADHLHAEEVSSEEVLQSIIGSIGDLDSPMTADARGFMSMVNFVLGETDEQRQKWRDGVLHASPRDFKDFAERLQKVKESGQVVVFGSQQAIDKANDDLPEGKKLVVEPAFSSSTTSTK